MNKKGFTLTELMAVLVILSFIGLFVLPNLFSLISDNKKEEYESYAQLVKYTLEMYNIDKKEDLWTTNTFVNVPFSKLKETYKDLDLNHETCKINKDLEIKKEGTVYKYKACIVCDSYKTKDCK